MARSSELQSLVAQFVTQLQDVISREVKSEIAGKFDAVRTSIFTGVTGAPGRAPRATAAVVAAKGVRRSPLAGREAEQKPCPVCNKLTKARRFSYLCEEHRTPENLAKFKGAAKGGAPAAAPPMAAKKTAAPAKAAKSAGKRGPGRPKGSKNKKKASAGKTESAPKAST